MNSLPSADGPAFFLTGGGEAGKRIRGHDWASSPLGLPESWPRALQTLVSVILGSRQAMFIVWGHEHTLLYNDAYSQILGRKHPDALGNNFLIAWSEIQDQLAPLVAEVYAGTPVHMDDITFTMMRHGYPEETHFAFSYTPVRDDGGEVAGVFCPCIETTSQILAERRLTEENERQRKLFERAPGFIAIMRGPQHLFEFANAAYRDLIGGRDPVGKTVRESLPEVEGQGFFEWLDQVYHTGERIVSRGVLIRLQRLQGAPLEDRFVDFIYEPVISEAGDITGIFLEGHDVTEAHRAQDALRASELQFSALAQALPNIVWTAQPEGGVDWFNDTTFGYSGQVPGTLRQHSWTELLHSEDAHVTHARWLNAVASGEAYEIEARLRRHDGMYRWHLTRAVPICSKKGDVVRWVGTSTDIHDQKLAAQTLRDLNEELERRVKERTEDRDRVWENSRDLLAIVGPDGVFRAANPAWTQVLGYHPSEVEGAGFDQFAWPDDLSLATLGFETARAKTNLTNFEVRCRHRDGTYRWISWHTSGGEKLIYAYGRDVTAEREQANALKLAEEQLRQAQKMEAVGQLTGGIAHDFNNLLTGIISSLELMLTRVSQGRTDNISRYAAGAMGSAQRAAALTHRLLAFARRQPLDPKQVDVNRLVVGMKDLLRRTLGPLYRLDFISDPALWMTRCDPYQLETTLINVVINARDSMPGGGSLRIETLNVDLESPDQAADRNIAPGQYVVVQITDTGFGMTADVVKRAMEPFFTTKPLGQGTGLGLSMVYGFAKQSEGHLEINSAVNEGTTVRLFLPRHIGKAEPEPALVMAEPASAGKSATVLLVEDESIIREVVAESLMSLGYDVLQAADGLAGLELFKSNHPIDLLITDIGLPGLNGQMLAENALLEQPGLKVLFMTGYAENTTMADGFLLPGMGMLTKPFTITAMETKVQGILQHG